MSEQRERWLEEQRRITERTRRVLLFARSAIEDKRELHPDWRAAAWSALDDLERIVERNAHPDDVDRARAAIFSLACLFTDVESVEVVYLGDDATQAGSPEGSAG